MKFKLVASGFDSETESDWDTAIDLVTTTITKSSHLIEAENGVRIFYTTENVSSSSRYLEPDFDEHPDGSGPMVYHDSPSDNRSRSSYGFGNAVAWKDLVPISVGAFQAFMDQREKSQSPFETTDDETEFLSGSELGHIDAFRNWSSGPISLSRLDQEAFLDPEESGVMHHPVGLTSDLIQLIDEAVSNTNEERVFEVALPAHVEANIQNLGLELAAKREAQTPIFIENMARESNVRLRRKIENFVMAQRIQMEEINAHRRKMFPAFSRNCY
jgi:hypothetical protein